MDAFLSKPVRGHELREVLDALPREQAPPLPEAVAGLS